MTIDKLRTAGFNDLEEDQLFWKAVRSSKAPHSMEDLRGPYYVYSATGHVLNKLFRLEKPLQDHELQKVALDDKRNELFLMNASDVVYIPKEE
ncbi:MAG: hypothetical protein GY801_32870 [bacterium]|nr:hypothetical protein [bacterium]